MELKGEIYRVSGPVVTARGVSPRMYDVVLVGHEKLMGEVIGLEGDDVIIQYPSRVVHQKYLFHLLEKKLKFDKISI